MITTQTLIDCHAKKLAETGNAQEAFIHSHWRAYEAGILDAGGKVTEKARELFGGNEPQYVQLVGRAKRVSSPRERFEAGIKALGINEGCLANRNIENEPIIYLNNHIHYLNIHVQWLWTQFLIQEEKNGK